MLNSYLKDVSFMEFRAPKYDIDNMNSDVSDTDLLASMLEVPHPTTAEDNQKLDLLVAIIERYDVYDFICRISALNLLIANQNKSILFDALIAKVISKGRSNYHSNLKMSSGNTACFYHLTD